MPRLIDGQIPTEGKFKKRRAWLSYDTPTLELDEAKIEPPLSLEQTTQILPNEEDCNKTITRVEQECNKSVTRLEQDYNKTRTRVKQENPPSDAIKQKTKNEYNKTVTRLEQDYSKSITRLEQDYNKSTVTDPPVNWIQFLEKKRSELFNLDSNDPKLSLIVLSDLQQQIFWHIAKHCISRNTANTGPIEIKSFFGELDITTGVVRTTLNRLGDKRLIQREKGKLGRNGFAVIGIPLLILEAAKDILSGFPN